MPTIRRKEEPQRREEFAGKRFLAIHLLHPHKERRLCKERPPFRPVITVLADYPELHRLVAPREWAQELLQGLSKYDEQTFFHSVQVGLVARKLGGRLVAQGKMTRVEQDELTLAALLHDIGKAGLGKKGKELLLSTEQMGPDHPLRIHARQHVEKGFHSIKRRTRLLGITVDVIGLHAAQIMAFHHLHQPNDYGLKREINVSDAIKEMGRLLAACDQAASLGLGAGHGFIPSNLPLEEVRKRLVFGREGNGKPLFEDIADDLVSIIAELRGLNQG